MHEIGSALPQTKFVTSKALKLGLKPIVVVNKIDRQDARAHEIHTDVFDLFAALDATDEQLDFPTLYASGRSGWAVRDLDKDERKDLTPLFETVVSHVKAPAIASKGTSDYPFSMLVRVIQSDPYLGRILTGRIESGVVNANRAIKALSRDGEMIERGRITKVLAFRGLTRVPVEEASAGDIVAIAGLTIAGVADTLCDPEILVPIPANPIDPPTIAITIGINDSPYAGREGQKVQSRVIRERLFREAEGNVAIKVRETENADAYEVAGRGELQLGVLIETMRREGFELSISRPRVLFRDGENGQKLEPIEEVIIDVDDAYSGVVIAAMSLRKGEMTDMRPSGGGKTRLTFFAPSRGLIGYHGQFLTDTRGTGIMNRVFHEFGPHRGQIEGRRQGVLISDRDGEAATYALWYLEERGILFIESGTKVYQGMVIGEHSRDNDLDVNALKAKQLTNFRASGKDEAVRLTPPKLHTLEQAIAYIGDDELVEVTPKSIRLRKRWLDPNERKKYARATGADN